MLSLSEKIQNTVEINGVEYRVDTSFDNILDFFSLMDERIDDTAKINVGLRMLLKEELDVSFEEKSHIFNEIVKKFLTDQSAQKSLDLKGNPMPESPHKEYFSIKYDAELIYAAFMEAYGIDLLEQQGKLEWRKFKALLAGLPASTRFCEVIEIRQRKYPRGKGTEEERSALRKLKQEFSYPGSDFT